jgi:HEAT repeat protein
MDVLSLLGDEGRNAVLRLLRDPRWYAVRNGVILLSEIGDASTVQPLTVALAHSDPRVRRETLMALAKIGGEDAGLLIIGMLEDAHPDVRSAAAMGSGALRQERAQRPLLALLATEGVEEVQIQILLALGQIGDPGSVPAIEKRAAGTLFGRPPKALRIAAYRALAAIGSPHARSVVEAGATDRNPEVRQAVEGILRNVSKGSGGGRTGG